MDKWSLNNHRLLSIEGYSDKDLQDCLFEPIKERINFRYDTMEAVVPRYFMRIIGMEDQEVDYYNYLFDLSTKLKKLDNLYLEIPSGFSETIDKDLFKRLNMAWSELLFIQGLKPQHIVENLVSKGFLLDFPNKVMEKQLHNTYLWMIELFYKNNFGKLDMAKLKQLVFFTVHWYQLYVEKLMLNFDYTQMNPKILFYGDIAEEEVYLLMLFSQLGMDVLYFHPEKDSVFHIVDIGLSTKVDFPRKIKVKPFPLKRETVRTNTIAYGVSEEIQDVLSVNQNYFRPWALVDFIGHPITLKTTYSEIMILAKEQAMIRPEWKVQDNHVYFSNIFAKVIGLHQDRNKFWEEVEMLTNQKHTLFFNSIPITGTLQKVHLLSNLQLLDIEGEGSYFSPEKLMAWEHWTYKTLPLSLQKKLAYEICEMCNRLELKNHSIPNDNMLRFFILSKSLELESELLTLLQSFDYPKEVPKVIIYRNNKSEQFTFEEAIVTRLLNRLGLDIVIYNTSGYSDIELYLESKYYDTHRLEDFAVNVEYRKKGTSFLKSLFSR